MSTHQNNPRSVRFEGFSVEVLLDEFMSTYLSIEKVSEHRKSHNLSCKIEDDEKRDKLINYFSVIDNTTGREQALSWDTDALRYTQFNIVRQKDWWEGYAGGSKWFTKFITKLDLFRQKHFRLQVSTSDNMYRHTFYLIFIIIFTLTFIFMYSLFYFIGCRMDLKS